MQQDLNSENFLWPSCGIDFRLSIKPITGGDKFLSLLPYTVSIRASTSTSARSTALLPSLPLVGFVTSSWQHLKFPPTSVDEQMSWWVVPSLLRDCLLTHCSWMEKSDQKMKEPTKLHWSTGVQQTDLSHATARWKAAYSVFSFEPAFLLQWCRTPGQQYPKGNSLSGKHWEKMGRVLARRGETQLVPGRPAQITEIPALPTRVGSSILVCALVSLTRDSIRKWFYRLAPQEQFTCLHHCNCGVLLEGGTSMWDPEVQAQLWGERRRTSPHHAMLSWPKLLMPWPRLCVQSCQWSVCSGFCTALPPPVHTWGRVPGRNRI